MRISDWSSDVCSSDLFEASFRQGVNVYLGGMANHYSVSVRSYEENGKLGEPVNKGFSTEVFAQSAIDFIQHQAEQGNKKPFFCYVAFTAPHDPYSSKADYTGLYPRSEESRVGKESVRSFSVRWVRNN